MSSCSARHSTSSSWHRIPISGSSAPSFPADTRLWDRCSVEICRSPFSRPDVRGRSGSDTDIWALSGIARRAGACRWASGSSANIRKHCGVTRYLSSFGWLFGTISTAGSSRLSDGVTEASANSPLFISVRRTRQPLSARERPCWRARRSTPRQRRSRCRGASSATSRFRLRAGR